MRRSNWKTKVVVIVAFILSVIAGIVAAMFTPDVWKGLVGFGTFAVVLLVLVFILVKVLRIGRN
jgi:VIT1/CCC1 family predicted Fe2+/Mn2+ transporter